MKKENTPNDFPYDVFLSHSAKDKAVVRSLAERLRVTLSQLSTLNHQPIVAPLNKERRFIPLPAEAFASRA